ncbi:MAG: hypothetical protein EXQ85_02185 [Alphaproteobacteria bacterium]|nr:hypothetical protein [Alphaproteobacteria bacterium]
MPTDISPLVPVGRQLIRSYGPGRFIINEVIFRGSVLVFPDRTLAVPAQAIGELTLEHLAQIRGERPPVELLLFGCGPTMQPIASELRAVLRGDRIGVDFMATPAACRTYNVLMAEDRRVAALLIALPIA